MKKKIKRKLTLFLISVVLLSLLELALIVMDVIEPVFSFSPGSLILVFAALLVVLYAGVVYADEGVGRAALNGACLGFAYSSVICIGGLASRLYFIKPVLGIGADTRDFLFLMLVLAIVANTIIGGIAAAFAVWLKKRLAR